MALVHALPSRTERFRATAFYAGYDAGCKHCAGGLQALHCIDIDLGASMLHVRKGWSGRGEIEPKSAAGIRTVPVLAILRDYRDDRRSREASLARSHYGPSPNLLPLLTMHEGRHTFAVGRPTGAFTGAQQPIRLSRQGSLANRGSRKWI